MSAPVRFVYTGSALPANGETVVLLATAPTAGVLTGVIGGAGNMGNCFPNMLIRRILVDITNDAGGTLREYQSVDRGANWVQINPDLAVAAAAANSVNQYDFLVEQYGDWKLIWVNGATPQTTFRVNIVSDDQRVVAN